MIGCIRLTELQPPEPLSGLALWVREALGRAEVRFDAKRFVPHLTVCRIRSRWRQEDAEAFAQTFGNLDAPSFEVREAVLFSSELQQKGAVDTILRRFPLSTDAPLNAIFEVVDRCVPYRKTMGPSRFPERR